MLCRAFANMYVQKKKKSTRTVLLECQIHLPASVFFLNIYVNSTKYTPWIENMVACAGLCFGIHTAAIRILLIQIPVIVFAIVLNAFRLGDSAFCHCMEELEFSLFSLCNFLCETLDNEVSAEF